MNLDSDYLAIQLLYSLLECQDLEYPRSSAVGETPSWCVHSPHQHLSGASLAGGQWEALYG